MRRVCGQTPTPNVPDGAGGHGLSTISLDFNGGRLDRRADGAFALAADLQQVGPAADAAASQTSARGLDWFTFFLSDIQTGFGPFVAIYLTSHQWAQFDIGLVLTAGGLAALAAQMPGGALVDAVRSAKLVATIAVLAICASALALALWPSFPVVMVSRILHATASCVLGPVIVALSLGLVGHAALGERLGRNARFASIGNGLAAAAMGLCGFLVSNQAVFFLTAALAAPAVLALARIRTRDIAGVKRDEQRDEAAKVGLLGVLGDSRLLVFGGCILLFQLANAAMLPLMGSILTVRIGEWASSLIGACIVVPQLVVVAIAPWVGRAANAWGRRRLLLLCFAALAVRGAVFALTTDPYLVVTVQLLDGISAAVLGVILPLVVADIMGGSGRFNLALGIVGSAVGIGAAISTTLAGYTMDHFGSSVTFVALASIAGCGLILVWLLLPETRPAVDRADPADQALPRLSPTVLRRAIKRGRSSAAAISSP